MGWLKELKYSYKGVCEIFERYWKVYGGWKALIVSPYFHISVVLLILTTHQWLYREWWEQSLSVLPNLLGFSLGGFAIFLGLGDEQFRSLLAEEDKDKNFSAYVSVSATFVHFILIQCLGIICALLSKALAFKPEWLADKVMVYFHYITFIFWGVGYFFLLYALTSVIAVVMAIFRVTIWYEKYQELSKDSSEE